MREIYLSLFALYLALTTFSQSGTISGELTFSSYLIDNSEYKDALLILKRLNNIPEVEKTPQYDSINFYTGLAYYQLKNLDSSAMFFARVGELSEFYFYAKFFQAFNAIYLGRYAEAGAILDQLETEGNEEMEKLRIFEYAGMFLLQRDFTRFDSLSKAFDYNFYSIAVEQENFIKYRDNLRTQKKKSPFLAGFLSSLLPGSGKFYAGYRGQAISAMTPSLMLAVVAVESLLKAGIYSPQFIIFGSMFSLFYIGNIWGSALSVQTKRFEIEYETNQNILLDLHLPLRRIFN